jgi:hypothetical protein
MSSFLSSTLWCTATMWTAHAGSMTSSCPRAWTMRSCCGSHCTKCQGLQQTRGKWMCCRSTPSPNVTFGSSNSHVTSTSITFRSGTAKGRFSCGTFNRAPHCWLRSWFIRSASLRFGRLPPRMTEAPSCVAVRMGAYGAGMQCRNAVSRLYNPP